MRTDRDDGFEAFFRAEYPRVVGAVRWIAGGSTAEEITQEAFCRALERWSRVRSHPNPGGWVQHTALRMAMRSERRRRRPEVLAPAGGADGPVDVDLHRAIAELPRGPRHAVVLHHLADLPVAEVAVVMKISESTVKTHLTRGRTALAAALGEHEEVSDAAR
jgi:RNA polymerase sigma-70 factor (ECF subfamily)